MGNSKSIRIKFLAKFKPGADGDGWENCFPGPLGTPSRWGNCEFIFDRYERDYDWLVVWDDLPSVAGERHTLWEEPLACPLERTLLVTTEPSSIKVYGSGFLRQFGHVLTSQERWAVGHHPGAIYSQTSYVWFYANTLPRANYGYIRDHIPLNKTSEISAVCSTKQQRHTLHHRRYEFVMELKSRIPKMELFGRGVRFVEDKADALDSFKYHVAIENFHGMHHWTEKLADPFLGACMPVYYGCPNAEDYFPAESFLRIDITNAEAASETIRRAIRDKHYEKNIAAILESRRRVVEEYAPAANISRIINELGEFPVTHSHDQQTIASRHLFRKRSIFNGASYAWEKTKVSLKHKISR